MSSIKETADKYREEFMRLYGGRTAQKEEHNESTAAGETASETKPPADSGSGGEKREDAAFTADSGDKNEASPKEDMGSVESRYPEPVLPDFIKNPETDTAPESRPEAPPDEQAWGYLLVQVRTGNGGFSVPGASVTVSKKRDGREEIYRLLGTDNSGRTELIRLPAKRLAQTEKPGEFSDVSTYDVAVYQKGFFREVSESVPIYQNIKSIQTFNLTPLPYAEGEGVNDTLIYQNTEPAI